MTGQLAPSPSFPGIFPCQEIVESPTSVSGISNLQPLWGRVFSFLLLPTGEPLVALLHSLPEGHQSHQAEMRKGKDVWVPLERYQAAMSDKRFPLQSTSSLVASQELPLE